MPLKSPFVRFGYISSTELDQQPEDPLEPRGKLIGLDLRSASGFSGSPVVLKRTGEVVGLIKGQTTQFRAGFSFATPIHAADVEAAREKIKVVGPE